MVKINLRDVMKAISAEAPDREVVLHITDCVDNFLEDEHYKGILDSLSVNGIGVMASTEAVELMVELPYQRGIESGELDDDDTLAAKREGNWK